MDDSSAERDPIERLADSFLTRYRAGERPSIESLVAKYPDLAAEIRELLPALIELEENLVPGLSAVRPTYSASELPFELGDYVVHREVGRGGMGVVYEATQRSLGRHVALKILTTASLPGTLRLERFRLEARAAARLHHTGIVPVFGFGEQNGVHYYAMQFIRGQGLDTIVDELRRIGERTRPPQENAPSFEIPNKSSDSLSTQSLATDLLTDQFAVNGGQRHQEVSAQPESSPPSPGHQVHGTVNQPASSRVSSVLDSSARTSEDAARSNFASDSAERRFYRSIARVGLQVADALAYAHAEGVLHRDIKPSNLLLDGRGSVWITDFGLAKANDAGELTRTGDVVGTLRYMAPERFDGWSDPRSDVYSLGATLYELSTLRPAFDEPSHIRLIDSVLRGNPTPPRKIDRKIPRDLETIVLKAMAKEPGARYPGADLMAEDLRRFLADRPILARRARMTEHLWRWCRRNRAMAALSGFMILLLVAIAVGATAVALQIRHQRDRLQHQGGQLTMERNQVVAERNRAVGLLSKFQQAERDRLRLLRESLLTQIQAGRFGGRAGRRFDGLAAAARAASIQASPALRDEAIACLALPDIRPLPAWNGFAVGGYEIGLDHRLERYAQIEPDGTVRVRRVGDGIELIRLAGVGPGHGNPSFSPDGRWLAVPRVRGAGLVIYDLDAGVRVLELAEEETPGNSTWSPDSQQFAVIRDNGLVMIYDTASWREVSHFREAQFPAHDLAYDSAGARLAIASLRGTGVRIIDPHNGTVLHQYDLPSAVHAVAWCPGGNLVATGCTDNLIRMIDVAGNQSPRSMAGHLSAVIDLAFHPEGDLLASYGWDGMLKLWDVHAGKPLVATRIDPRGRLRFSRDGRRLGANVRGSNISLWEVSTARECRSLYGHHGELPGPKSLTFSTDGRMLASAGVDGVRLWDPTRGQERAFIPLDGAGSVAFMPDAEGLLIADPRGVTYWPIGPASTRRDEEEAVVGPPRQLFSFMGLNDNNVAQVVSSGRRLIALDSARGDVLTTSIDQPQSAYRYMGNWGAIYLAVSSDGRWTATSGGAETSVRIWDLRTRNLARELPTREARTAFSPDGRWLVVGSPTAYEFFETQVWRAGPRLERDQAHLPGVMAFSSDGRLLAVASSSHNVRIVDTATVTTLATLTASEPHLISCISFSPHGEFLAVGTENHVIQLWDLGLIRQKLSGLGIPLEGTLGAPTGPDTDPGQAGRALSRLRVQTLP